MSKYRQNKQNSENINDQIRHTADVVAVNRFNESKKKNPLVFDPYAHFFVSSRAEEMLAYALKKWPFFSEYLIVRTKFFDDHLKAFCKKGQIRQIVILGAGNDMRAVRLSFLKRSKVFEVDFPDQIANKMNLIKNQLGCLPENVVYIGFDIKQTNLIDILTKNGFNLQKKSVFILEGLIYYLSSESVDNLFRGLSQIPSNGNLFLLDQISMDMIQNSSDPEKSRPPYPVEPITYLNHRNFSILESAFLGDLTSRYLDNNYKERWWAIACKK